MLSKIANNSNKITMRIQATQDSYNAIFDINFIVVIDIYDLFKNIVEFASKST